MISFLEGISNWWTVLLLLLCAILLTIPFQARNKRIEAHANQKIKLLGGRFHYSPAEIDHLMEAIGPSGRRLYAITELALDLPFPIVYSLFLSVSLLLVYAFFISHHPGLRNICLIPFLVLVVDYLETASIVTIAFRYPRTLVALDRISSFLTSMKWILLLGALALIVIGIGIKILGR